MKNQYHIEVKECCASCGHKDLTEDGTRICLPMQLIVMPNDKCRQWQMSKGLQNAGKSGGVVRQEGTTETIIH